MLRVRLFGGLAGSWGKTPLPAITGTASRSLFAYLLTYRDRPHTRDLLAGTFWPDLPDNLARRRLTQALWQIRKALEPHSVLLTKGDTVQINPNLPIWLDIEEFARHKAQCLGEDTAEVSEALGHCELCLEHYRGDFLAGYYDDWLFPEREQRRDQLLEVLERLVVAYKGRGDYEPALTYARRLVAEDALHEQAHCEVMRLCHLLGRDNEALQQYHLCRQVLANELDAEPSASTVALVGEIASQAAAEIPHLPVASRPSPLVLLERPDQVPLVGRQAERAELARYLELAADGHGSLVLMAGRAGLGKTRLMQEVARDAAWRGIRVVWGHSCELCSPPPYQSLVEVLHDADLTYLPAIWQRELGRLLPGLGQHIPGPAPPLPTLEPELEQGRMLEALARAFLALGQAAPHLVILEDVHWIDPASFEALRVLLPRLSASRLLVVCTLRPEELAGQPAIRQGLAALEHTRLPRRLELAPLTAAETGALIQRVLDLSRPVTRFSQRLYSGTGGNPFFLTETLRTLVDGGLLYRDEDGQWRTPWDDASGDYAGLPVPPSVAQSIEQRLERLSPAVRDLLGIAAVVGGRVEFDLWLAAGECDEKTVLTTAEELVWRGLLVDADDVLGYRFIHDTIRQVVYKGVSPVRRRRWHRRVAAALEALHPGRVEALAHHHRLGQNWPQAVRYAVRAGEQAQAVYASQQALDYYHSADTWLAQGRATWPADQVARWRADLAEKQGQIHSVVGAYQAGEDAFALAWEAWSDLGDWRGAARVLNRLSFWLCMQGDYARASHYAQKALDTLPEADGPSDLRAASLVHLGLSAWSEGRYDDALPPLEQALALFEAMGTDSHGLARCLNSLGLVHLERGDLALADECFARSLTLRRQNGNRWGEAWCWHNQGRAALARSELDVAREKLETARAIFAEVEHTYGLEASDRVLAEVEQAAGAALKYTTHLPRADAPTGRPLRDDEYVTVTWTVAAPEDGALADRVARRQQRLLRLLQEAAAQGASPTMDDLAEALDVSQPTVRRDLAALRQAGHAVQTRGSRQK